MKWLWLFVPLLFGCSPSLAPLEPCVHTEVRFGQKAIGPSDIDVVYVLHGLDDDARAELARTAPAFLEALRTGDLDGDGALDFDPPFNLGVSVSTADLCESRAHAVVERDGSRRVEVDGPSAIDDVVARLNDARSACSVGQPLEALRRALDLPFHVDNRVASHGRLVVIFASPEDDCSLSAGAHPADVVGCTEVERVDVAEYARRFTVENELHVLTLTGLPTDVDGLSRPLDEREVLARADLEERLESDALVPSCTRGAMHATPPRRWLAWSEALAELDVFAQHASLCAPDLSPAFAAFAHRIARHDTVFCFFQDPGLQVIDGLLACQAVDQRADNCADREDRLVTELGCTIPQVAPGEAGGWYFETLDDALEGSDLAWLCPHAGARLVGAFPEVQSLVCAMSCAE